MRFCADYQRLDALTIRESYRITRTEECKDFLGEANIFTTLDENSGYWHIESRNQDKGKMDFDSHHGLYRFIRMRLELKNAPGTLQRVIDVILYQVKWKYAMVYLDDAIVFRKSPEEHFTNIAEALRLIRDADVTLKLKSALYYSLGTK